MKIGIVLGTNEPEVVWNTFRFGITSLKANHEVKIFLKRCRSRRYKRWKI